jgi:hypothetical protein
VTRAACPTNGRITNATLTDEGYATVAAVAPTELALARAFVVDALSPAQLRELTAISRQILTRVDPQAAYPPRGTAARP